MTFVLVGQPTSPTRKILTYAQPHFVTLCNRERHRVKVTHRNRRFLIRVVSEVWPAPLTNFGPYPK